MRFSKKEMEEFSNLVEDSPIDSTIHIHHCKQGTGNDRCYITKKADTVLAYCHHCGCKGALSVSRAAYKRHTGRRILSSSSANLPGDIKTDPRQWPVEALEWPLKARLSFSDMEVAGLCYSPSYDRVFVPVLNDGYQGYVARRVGGDGPKYVSRTNNKDKMVYSKIVDPSSDMIILVEDVLSVIQLSKSGYNAVALLGTSLTDGVKSFLIGNDFSRFIIWLDNDNPQVIINQVEVKKALSMFGSVSILHTNKDPKEFRSDQIKEIIDEI